MASLEYAFLADAADARPGEKFNVLGGGVARLGGSTLPFRHPHLALVVGIGLGPGESAGEHEVRFTLVSPTRQELASATGTIQGQGQADAGPTLITVAIDLWNLTFEAPGQHLFHIAVDGVERKQLPLHVDRVEVAPGPVPVPEPPGGRHGPGGPGVN